MCGRYTLVRSAREIGERFGIKQLSIEISPRYNIAPSQSLPVVLSEAGERVLQSISWGLIPSWVKDLSKTKALINARSESLAEKPSFKVSLKRRRCIVPADGFYEWKKTAAGNQPFYIHAADEGILAFAGLWDEWKNEEGDSLRTFCLITSAANTFMSVVHDRMPVILSRESEDKWLDPAIRSPEILLPLLGPCPENLLQMHEVSTLVNSVREDRPDLIEHAGQQLRLKL